MTKQARRRAVILDRDDTIIPNVPYNGDPSKVRLLPGAPEALGRLRRAGFDLLVFSNQSGVGRGLITEAQVRAVNDEVERQLGGKIFLDVLCAYDPPDTPGGADLRKPSPAMLLAAAEKHGLDLKTSFVVGDRLADVQCGKRAGCRSVLVLTGDGSRPEMEQARAEADFVAPDLAAAADWILAQG